MPHYENPFAKLDIDKMMADFKLPGVDVEAMSASQRKNLEALSKANQVAIEGFQAVGQRQAEIMQEAMQEVSDAVRDIGTAQDPEKAAAKQTEMVQSAYAQAIENMRELAEMVTKSNQQAFGVIAKRVEANIDEARDLYTPGGKKSTKK